MDPSSFLSHLKLTIRTILIKEWKQVCAVYYGWTEKVRNQNNLPQHLAYRLGSLTAQIKAQDKVKLLSHSNLVFATLAGPTRPGSSPAGLALWSYCQIGKIYCTLDPSWSNFYISQQRCQPSCSWQCTFWGIEVLVWCFLVTSSSKPLPNATNEPRLNPHKFTWVHCDPTSTGSMYCVHSRRLGPWESVRLDLQKEESVRG